MKFNPKLLQFDMTYGEDIGFIHIGLFKLSVFIDCDTNELDVTLDGIGNEGFFDENVEWTSYKVPLSPENELDAYTWARNELARQTLLAESYTVRRIRQKRGRFYA